MLKSACVFSLVLVAFSGCSNNEGVTPKPKPELVRLTDGSFGVDSPAWSPDGQAIAFEMYPGNGVDIGLITLSSGETRILSSHPESEFLPVWTPDSKKVYFVRHNDFEENCREIWCCDISTGALEFVCTGNLPSFSPDGRFMLTSAPFRRCSINGLMVLRDMRGGVLDTLNWAADREPPVWSPKSPQIAYVGWASEFCGWGLCPWWYIWLTTVDGDRGVEIPGTGNPGRLSWSPDGRYIAYGCGGVRLLDAGSHEIMDIAVDPDVLIQSVSWAPDGDRLAAAGREGEHNYLYIVENVLE